VRIDDLMSWQVVLLPSGVDSWVPSGGTEAARLKELLLRRYEHVILPRVVLEALEQSHVIGTAPLPLTKKYKTPVDAVLLVNMTWVRLDGAQIVRPELLRTHVNLYRKLVLADLLEAVKRLNPAWMPLYSATGQLSAPDKVPARPPEPENPAKQQVEKVFAKGMKELGVERAKPSPGRPPTRSAVDVSCLIDKATLQLFEGTAVVRDVVSGSVFGLRDQLRRAKAREEG
jgi:hypothetical protein